MQGSRDISEVPAVKLKAKLLTSYCHKVAGEPSFCPHLNSEVAQVCSDLTR